MKTSRFFPHLSIRRAFILLTGIGLISPSVHAQTFASQSTIAEQPASLRTIITPVANSSIIRIRFENQGRGSVQVQLRDEKGILLLDESQPKREYAGQFDLASLPAGQYTIELRTVDARYQEIIRIEPTTAGRVVVSSEPSATQKLLAKQ